MEPKLIRKDIKYQKKTLIIVSLLVISLFVGGSFALLSSSDETEEVVTFKTGNFNLEVATAGTLSLDGEVPKSYDDGFKNSDITLTLTNTGSLEIGKYEVKLDGDTGTTLDANYIRYSVSDDEEKTYLASKLLSETNNIIYTGYSLKDTKVLKVKLWIDEKAGEAALKKSYNGKINVELYQNDDTLVDVVKSKLVSNYSGSSENFEGGLVAVNTNGDLYHETNSEEIREYRYSGPTVNNYVTFNEEMWRIIGVFKDEENTEHVKIVKNETLSGIFPETYTISGTTYNIRYTSNDISAYWNNKVSGTNNNDWATSGLQYWLNTKEDENEVETNKGYLSTLKGNALSMIEETKYYLGTITYDSVGSTGIIDNPKTAYVNERDVESCVGNTGKSEIENGCKVFAGNQATWKGKVALLYQSDYGFSTKSSNWEMQLSNFSSIKSSSWLNSENHSSYEWMLSPTSNGPTRVSFWHPSGTIGTASVSVDYGSIRPTINLISDVKITSGDGTSANPYKLILN